MTAPLATGGSKRMALLVNKMTAWIPLSDDVITERWPAVACPDCRVGVRACTTVAGVVRCSRWPTCTWIAIASRWTSGMMR